MPLPHYCLRLPFFPHWEPWLNQPIDQKTCFTVDGSENDMARLMTLRSLPRSNHGNQHQYKRVNGPAKLILSRTGEYKLPYGNMPRL